MSVFWLISVYKNHSPWHLVKHAESKQPKRVGHGNRVRRLDAEPRQRQACATGTRPKHRAHWPHPPRPPTILGDRRRPDNARSTRQPNEHPDTVRARKPIRGGRRAGAGRKASADPTVVISVRLSATAAAAVAARKQPSETLNGYARRLLTTCPHLLPCWCALNPNEGDSDDDN